MYYLCHKCSPLVTGLLILKLHLKELENAFSYEQSENKTFAICGIAANTEASKTPLDAITALLE
jgi:hypothetical protein